MKVVLVVTFSALLLFTAGYVRADEVSDGDPRTIIVDPGPPNQHCQQLGPTFTSFGILVDLKGQPQPGGGVTTCANESGQNWVGLDIFATVPKSVTLAEFEASLICGGSTSIFPTCAVQAAPPTLDFDNKTVFEILLSGGVIEAGSTINIVLNDKNKNGGGWGGFKHNPNLFCPVEVPIGQSLCAEAVLATVPEPATLLFVITGIGSLWLWQKRSRCDHTSE